ncbi:uncharacterized protein B0H64DRAFT_453040, partial [Chaetomium fimeti]
RHRRRQRHRHCIAILDLNAATGPGVAAEVAAEFPRSAVSFHPCNVASWDEQAAAFQQAFNEHGGRLDVVVANAGVSEQGATTLVRLPLDGGGGGEDEGRSRPGVATLEVNLLGTVYSVNLAVHYMNKKPKPGAGGASRGSIICTASNAGLYPLPVAPLYAACKFGVVGLVRSTARIIEQADMQINALAPAVLGTWPHPSSDLFKHMTVTPLETLIRGVGQFLRDPTVSGAVAEIHGDTVFLGSRYQYHTQPRQQNTERRTDKMDIRTEPFRRPGKAPLLWNRTVCDCHWFYQFYLCGCPDRVTPIGNGRTRHEPCYQGCEVWYKPKWEQVINLTTGFRHNPNPPLRPEPSVLPFPCHRHLMESRIFLSAEELHTMRNRLMDPMWNPEQSSSWEDKKRAREEEDDGLLPPPPLRRRILRPEAEEVIQLQPRLGDLVLELRCTPDDHHYIDPPAPNAGLTPSPRYSWQIPSGQSAFPIPNGRRVLLTPSGPEQDDNRSQQNSRQRSPPPPYIAPPAYTRSPPGPPPALAAPQELPPPYVDITPAAPPRASARNTSGPRRSRNHFSSLTWLLEEQAIDLWRQDGYHWHSAPVKREAITTTRKQQKKKKNQPSSTTLTHTLTNPNPSPSSPPSLPALPALAALATEADPNPAADPEAAELIRDVLYDGPTHTGYFGGAYRTDPEVLHQARAVSWQRAGGAAGLAWARRVGEAWAASLLPPPQGQGQGQGQFQGGGGGGWWLGGRFSM